MNFQRNEIIKKNNSYLTYSNRYAKFDKLTLTDEDFQKNHQILDSIQEIIDSTQIQFLSIAEQKIIFLETNIDTLKLKIDLKREEYKYYSTLKKGFYTERYNELLINNISPLLTEFGIKKIELFTNSPTEFNDIPPPPGTLSNFDHQ